MRGYLGHGQRLDACEVEEQPERPQQEHIKQPHQAKEASSVGLIFDEELEEDNIQRVKHRPNNTQHITGERVTVTTIV